MSSTRFVMAIKLRNWRVLACLAIAMGFATSTAIYADEASASTGPSTARTSTNSANGQASDDSDQPVISANGRYVAFRSVATDLIGTDTNMVADIYVKDTQTGSIKRASVATGDTQSNQASSSPSISADGRYVAYSSTATNLVAGDGNMSSDVFVTDMQTTTTVRASTSTAGTEATNSSTAPRVSADGQHVSFTSSATNLVANDNNGRTDIFVKNLQSGTTARASTTSMGAESPADCNFSAISADGSFVLFSTNAATLVAGDGNAANDIFRKNTSTGELQLVSSTQNGDEGNSDSTVAAISDDGDRVAFRSSASNFVAGDANAVNDIYVKTVSTGEVARASAAADGAGPTVASVEPAISGDGQLVGFSSSASTLVGGDTNGAVDSFVKNVDNGSILRASINTAATQGDGDSTAPSLSLNGRFVAYTSAATNLAAGADTNGKLDAFRRDLGTGDPQASVGASELRVRAGQPISFDGTASIGGEFPLGSGNRTAVANYSWQLPDGSTVQNDGHLTVTPTTAGTYSVTLTVTDASSEIDTATAQVIVDPAPTSPAAQPPTTKPPGTSTTPGSGSGKFKLTLKAGTTLAKALRVGKLPVSVTANQAGSAKVLLLLKGKKQVQLSRPANIRFTSLTGGTKKVAFRLSSKAKKLLQSKAARRLVALEAVGSSASGAATSAKRSVR